jgi:glycolate oxidase FAD binding subunit
LIATPATTLSHLAEIVGREFVRAASPGDAIDGVQPKLIVEPGSNEEAGRVLQFANAAGLKVAPRGGGTKMDWGNPPRTVDVVLSTRRLDRVLEHAWGDMTTTVEAGCTIERLQQKLAEHGQRLAIDPLWPKRATVGGILATNDSGSLRIRFGSLRDLVIGVTVALPNGTVAKSGGKVVKNVAGYDLQKLMTGSLGTLGVILDANFRLHPLASETRTFSVDGTVQELNRLALEIHNSTLVPTGLQIDAGCWGPARLDVRFEGISAAIEAQTDQLCSMTNELIDAKPVVWDTREQICRDFTPNTQGLICKLSVLPTDLEKFCDVASRIASSFGLLWFLVAQSVGLGYIRMLSPSNDTLVEALKSFREELKAFDGSLVVCRCTPGIKERIDVWGTDPDSLPLMKSVKSQFDPAGILNPGRYLGGI